VAKHPSNQQTTVAKHPSEVVPDQHDSGDKATARANDGKASAVKRGAAKHLPDDDRRSPNEVDATERRQAQKRKLSEESKRRPQQKLPRRRLKGGSDAKGAVAVRPP